MPHYRNRLRRPGTHVRPLLRASLVLGLITLLTPIVGFGQLRTGSSGASQSDGPRLTRSYPEFQRTRDLTLGALGVGAMSVGLFSSPDVTQVPDAGLDPTSIRFGMDRDIIGNRSTSAEHASDWARNAALLMPWAMAALTGPEGDRWHAMGARTLLYAETFSISLGLTMVTKVLLSRPRPFAYLPSADRPEDGHYDPSRERAFLSMPSGHTSAAWTASGLSMTEYLLYRPEATWVERAAVGVFGGALGASTAALRVRAGQHFPSDVLVGSALGLASGITFPVLHRGSHPLPSTEAWLQMSGGMVVGTVLGVLLSRSF